MTVGILLGIIVVLAAINVFLWKFGFVQEAEKPPLVDDRPVVDAAARKAVLKRLKRWRDKGKLTRDEFERFAALCESEWS